MRRSGLFGSGLFGLGDRCQGDPPVGGGLGPEASHGEGCPKGVGGDAAKKG